MLLSHQILIYNLVVKDLRLNQVAVKTLSFKQGYEIIIYNETKLAIAIPLEVMIENKCPDCLFLKLEPIPIKEGLFNRKSDSQIDLYLTINFNSQWQELLGGKVEFGIRHGELRLILENGKIPYGSRSFNDYFPTSTKFTICTEESSENSGNASASFKLPGKGLNLGIKTDSKNKENRKEQFEKTISHISTKGDEEKPVWVFEADTDDLVLKGTITEQKLATMDIVDNPYSGVATFEISKSDVCLMSAEGILPQNISQNKRAWIEELIILQLLKSKFQPYMSKVEF